MRIADREAIEKRGIASITLMERAAGAVAEKAMEYLEGGKAAFVFCGSGNNGGDGIGAALELLKKGMEVRVFMTGSTESLTPDCAEMLRRLRLAGGSAEPFCPDDPLFPSEMMQAGVIIDAMFGIGLNRAIHGNAACAIELINASGVPVVSADIPSGIEADTGRILGCAVRASDTMSFSMGKTGQFSQPGNVYCGRVHIVDIGIPEDILEKAGEKCFALCHGEITLPRRNALSHKGDHGKILIIAGSPEYCGAPNLCSNAAVRAGAGLVYLGVPEEIHGYCAVKNNEAMPFALKADASLAWAQIQEKLARCSVCVIGPGMGRSRETADVVYKVAESYNGVLVADADALWAIGKNIDILKRRPGKTVLTPHDGEFILLGGELSGDRTGDARAFAQEHGVCLLLKGHRSIAAFPDGECYISTFGNAGMAKGGSGDVLAGILGAMLGQFEFRKAVLAAMQLHGMAGDICRDLFGEYSMTASDIIDMLPGATMDMLEE